MQEAVELIFHGFDYSFLAMADVEASNTSGEIQVAVAVDIFQPGVFGLGNVNRRAVRKPAGHSFRAALREGPGLRARDGSAELNGRHRKFQFLELVH